MVQIDPRFPLFGLWRVHPEDRASIEKFGNITLEFTRDGRLIYTVLKNEGNQELVMHYRVEKGYLFTRQPQDFIEEKISVFLTEDGNGMILVHNSQQSRYVRVEE